MTALATPPLAPAIRPSALRRTALVAAAVPACALPTLWGAGAVAELVTGAERDHLFHQLTGQGLLLSALWLGALIQLLVAGWRGARPSSAAGLAHVAVVVGAAVAAALAPGNGGAIVAAIALVTGALVWLALPQRPTIAVSGLDPVLTPIALGAAALFAPFVVSEAALQRGAHDEHAEFSHYFDMAWISVALVVLALAAAVVPAARRLALVAMLGTLGIGAARFLITPEVTWSLVAVGLGAVGTVAALARLARRDG
jgi:hypothetical protein